MHPATGGSLPGELAGQNELIPPPSQLRKILSLTLHLIHPMKKSIVTLGFALALILLLSVSRGAPPAPPTNDSDLVLGQTQVEKLWAEFARPDLDALDHFVAPGFQSLHEDGARDWSEERKLVAALKLTPYVLLDFKVTRQGDVLLVTYRCSVGETIAAARLAKTSTPRLDVFQQIDGEWKLLSHVNVRRIVPSEPKAPDSMMIAAARE